MSKQVDISDPSVLSDDDLHYAFDRGMITEEVMMAHLSDAPEQDDDEEDDEDDDGDEALAFDPAEHSVDEVLEYIDQNPDHEEAVLAAEAKGKARKGILG